MFCMWVWIVIPAVMNVVCSSGLFYLLVVAIPSPPPPPANDQIIGELQVYSILTIFNELVFFRNRKEAGLISLLLFMFYRKITL